MSYNNETLFNYSLAKKGFSIYFKLHELPSNNYFVNITVFYDSSWLTVIKFTKKLMLAK